ncbi:hypothetical protein HMPREF1981_02110 [Bacteroides pyogenes F0041]|uniref:Uncharacterized protein n=1 Tax=Bacteroides pyogenes F0041 TaxID=1321819 RepID=U2C323_9BACE|nr:hypothetical protein HMPREF1981_02110 [Bacteroides pyogenes F0041]GAE23999.1 hypothetical protein JCM10003_3861 [Bacteroides pyogenes JCM 10003]
MRREDSAAICKCGIGCVGTTIVSARKASGNLQRTVGRKAELLVKTDRGSDENKQSL